MPKANKPVIVCSVIAAIGSIIVAVIAALPQSKNSKTDKSDSTIKTDTSGSGNTVISGSGNTVIAPTSSSDSHAGSRQELLKILEPRHEDIRLLLDEEASQSPDPEAFTKFRNLVEGKLAAIRNALENREDIRARDTTKELLNLLESEEAKRLLPKTILQKISNLCFEPPGPPQRNL